MSDHCPACRVHRELTEHLATITPGWTAKRAALNFAAILARRACPNYEPAVTTEGDL